jgi:hypothetical protein
MDYLRIFPLWLVVLFLALAWTRRHGPQVRQWVIASVLVHAVGTIGMSWLVTNVTGGDMLKYERDGRLLAEVIWRDPGLTGEVFNLLMQREYFLPFRMIGASTSTGSMSAIAGLVTALVGAGGVVGGSVFSGLCLLSRVGLFTVCARWFPWVRRDYLYMAITLMPSVVIWSSGYFKEAVALTGLCTVVWGLDLIFAQRRYIIPAALVFVGFWMVFLFKGFFLVPLALALGLQLIAARSAARPGARGEASLVRIALGAALGVAGVFALSSLFPQLSLEQLTERTSELQAIGRTVTGGSSYQLGESLPTTLGGQLAFAPQAIFTALFRPLIIESTNALMVFNSLETSVLLLVSVLLLRGSWSERWRLLVRSPALVFCVVFVLAIALGIGLATSNLGTLSRYRMPLVPFFAVALLVLGTRMPATPVPAAATVRRR